MTIFSVINKLCYKSNKFQAKETSPEIKIANKPHFYPFYGVITCTYYKTCKYFFPIIQCTLRKVWVMSCIVFKLRVGTFIFSEERCTFNLISKKLKAMKYCIVILSSDF